MIKSSVLVTADCVFAAVADLDLLLAFLTEVLDGCCGEAIVCEGSEVSDRAICRLMCIHFL